MSIYRLASDGASTMPLRAGGPAPVLAPGAPSVPGNQLGSAIQAITAFIPGETITLFVGVATIVASWKMPGALVWWFTICAVISPLFFVVASINAAKSANRSFAVNARFVWRLVALLIAFVVWGTAVSPDTLDALALTFHWNVANQILHDCSSIAVLFTSPVLATIDSLFL